MTERLAALGARIERVALDPDGIESQRLFRIARPVLALTGWRAQVKYSALARLVDAVRAARRGNVEALERAERTVADAVDELEANIAAVERAAIVRKRPPVAHADWLRRAWELVQLGARALQPGTPGEKSDWAPRAVAHADRAAIAPPLALAPPKQAPGELVGEVPTRARVPHTDEDARLVELELAAVDRLLDAARAERNLLGRKRRLLVAARQRLLETCAALPVDAEGARARADHVAGAIARIDRLERAGLSADVSLVHQARLAVTRGDPRLAYAALAAVQDGALATGDERVASVAARAIGRVSPAAPDTDAAREASIQKSAMELLGKDVLTDVNQAVADARERAGAREIAARDETTLASARWESRHFCAGAELDLARATVAVDGCFEVGGALAPVRVADAVRVWRDVRHPTQQMFLVPARDVQDLPDAILVDPRTVLLDLAAGRLLSRRFVEEEQRAATRIVMRSEVRVYVLDGSGSMTGPRARVRDALMLAELATMIERLKTPRAVRCTLFYRYFNEELAPVVRVDSVAAAREAVRDVAGTARQGGTDIQGALVASLEQVKAARALDPDLARAQIVLVTDGEAAVSETVLDEARASGLGELPVGVSVIALGQENAALRGLVARERARGEDAYYHFLSDDQLADIVSGALDAGISVHLPGDPAELARLGGRLEAEIGDLVDELASIERERDLGALERLDEESRAMREVGGTGAAGEGERARTEALNRDRAALLGRFARWFPEPPHAAGTDAMPPTSSADRDDVEAVISVLASVAEVVALVGGSDLARRADAIELVERVLPDAGLTPAKYRAVLHDWPGATANALGAVHAALREPG